MTVSTKQAQVVAGIRSRIVDGSWPPGERLSPYPAMEQLFGVSRITVEHALRRLKRDGYVRALRRVGLFVTDAPPHRSCCALVFGIRRVWGGESHWSLFYEALARAAEAITRSGERRVLTYFGLNTPHESDDYRRLLADVRAYRVGGVIFSGSPHHLAGTPLLADDGMPKVALYSRSAIAHVPAVYTDERSFVAQALGWLAARGRRRIAMLSSGVYQPDGRREARFVAAVGRRGMATHPAWVQCPSPYSPLAIHHATLAAVQTVPCGQPGGTADGVVILDDNLVEPAMAAIRSAHRVPGRDLDVAVMCNFPAAPDCPRAVCRLGFDAAALLRSCIGILDRQRAGRPAPGLTLIPAVPAAEASRRRPHNGGGRR